MAELLIETAFQSHIAPSASVKLPHMVGENTGRFEVVSDVKENVSSADAMPRQAARPVNGRETVGDGCAVELT